MYADAEQPNAPHARQLLPREAYVCPKWYAQERRDLFSKTWNYAAMGDDFSRAGDYVCTQAGDFPLLVIRGEDGELRAHHNLCRHRGTRLLDGDGNAASGITCPYHHWHYGSDGTLQSVPRQRDEFPSLQLSSLSLKRASVGVFRGLVFVHPSDDPDESFAEFSEALDKQIGPHDPSAMVEFARLRFRFEANWKLVVENYLDAYHLFYLHARTATTFDHANFQWYGLNRHYLFYEPLKESARERYHARYQGAEVPLVPGTDTDTFGGHFHMLFPNLGWVGTAYYWNSFHAYPIDHTTTIVETRRRCMPMSEAAMESFRAGAMLERGGKNALERDDIISLDECSGEPLDSGNLMYEDMWICKRLQGSLESPAIDIGPFARHLESPIAFHQAQVARFMLNGS